jgi:choline-sulfatase
MARSMQIDYDEDVIYCAVRELYARARSTDKRPFLLTVSLTHPHDPYVIMHEYWDRYTNEEIDSPRVEFVPLDERDPHSHSLYFHYGQDKTAITPDVYRRARRAYYGMVSYVDDLFGRVMAALDTTGFADNTVVIFTSDHGDMLGERGMWFKKTLFEPAVRVPLVIAHPARGAARVNTPVSLVDVFPTLLDLAGTPAESIQTPLDGHSLEPSLNGRTVTAPVFVEHIDGGTIAPRVMVRNGDMKLVYSRSYPTQLYDLGADPDERINLAGTAECAEAEQHLTALVNQTWNLDTLASEVYADQIARRLIDTALGKGRRESWDFMSRPFAENERFVRRGDAFPVVERRGYLPYVRS